MQINESLKVLLHLTYQGSYYWSVILCFVGVFIQFGYKGNIGIIEMRLIVFFYFLFYGTF